MLKKFPHKQKVNIGSGSKSGQEGDSGGSALSSDYALKCYLLHIQAYIPFHSGPFGPMRRKKWAFFS